MGITNRHTQTPCTSYTNLFPKLFFSCFKNRIHYIWYMDDLDSNSFDCIAFIDEKNNNLTIKFIGIPNKQAAELFTDYVMMTLGVDYHPLNETTRSKMIH